METSFVSYTKSVNCHSYNNLDPNSQVRERISFYISPLSSFFENSAFIKSSIGEKLVEKDSFIVFYDVLCDSNHLLCRHIAIINPSTKQIFMEEPVNISKESLVNLLDILYSMEYETCYVLIEKKNHKPEKLRTLMSQGFSIVHPNVKKVPNYIVMGLEL
eukprot:gene4734-8317_t